jgi:hypothetical protein
MVNSLVAWFRRQSVARKLTATVVSTTGVTILASCAVFATVFYVTSRSRVALNVAMLADVVGANSTAALTFGDATAATDTLQSTASDEHILNARLFSRDGTLLATYVRANASSRPILPVDAGPPGITPVSRFQGNRLLVVRPIALNHEIVGSIVVESDERRLGSARELRGGRRATLVGPRIAFAMAYRRRG